MEIGKRERVIRMDVERTVKKKITGKQTRKKERERKMEDVD